MSQRLAQRFVCSFSNEKKRTGLLMSLQREERGARKTKMAAGRSFDEEEEEEELTQIMVRNSKSAVSVFSTCEATFRRSDAIPTPPRVRLSDLKSRTADKNKGAPMLSEEVHLEGSTQGRHLPLFVAVLIGPSSGAAPKREEQLMKRCVRAFFAPASP